MGAKLASLSGVLGATQDRGLSFITSGSVAAGSSLSIDGCFTSSYDNYRIIVNTNVTSTFRFRVSSADNSSANYYDQYINGSSTAISGARASTATSHSLPAGGVLTSLDVYGPALSAATSMTALNVYPAAAVQALVYGYFHNVASSFDGFSILGTTMTATVKVYGYRNA